jgi:hypothetical protein
MGSSKSGSLDKFAAFSPVAALASGKVKLPETGIVGMLQARQEDKMNQGAQMAQQEDDQMAQYMQMMQQQSGMNMGGRVGLSEGGEPSMERVLELEEQGFSYEEAYEKAMQELLDYKGGFAAGGPVESMNFLKQHLPYQDGGHVALRRKMFKLGGPVNTHGVGITSGLEYRNNYNAGGRVSMSLGGEIAKQILKQGKKIPGQAKRLKNYITGGRRSADKILKATKGKGLTEAEKLRIYGKLGFGPQGRASQLLRASNVAGLASIPGAGASLLAGPRMTPEERKTASDFAKAVDTGRGVIEFAPSLSGVGFGAEVIGNIGDTIYESMQENPDYSLETTPEFIRKIFGASTPRAPDSATERVLSKTKMSVDELAALNKQENQERMQAAMEQYAQLLAGSDNTDKLATLGDALIAGGSALMEGEGYGAAGRAFNEPLSASRRSKEERMSAANQAAAQLAISENMQIDAEQRGIVNEFLKTGSFSDAEANQLYSLAVDAGVQSLVPEDDGELDGDTLVNNPGVYADPKNLLGGGQVFVAVDSNGNVLPTNDPQEAKAHAAS